MPNLDMAKTTAVRDPLPELTPAAQDYLRALYLLAGEGSGEGRVTTSQLAARLAIRPASVTAMLQKLAAAVPPLIDYHKHHGAQLTADGLRAALAVVRCHRLIELFLHEKLGFGWDEVHAEADRLEHVMGPELVARLDEALGLPECDPHGHAIPRADLVVGPSEAAPLIDWPTGKCATVRHVRDDDPALLRRLGRAGLRPGVVVTVIERDPATQTLDIRIGAADDTVRLRHGRAQHIFVA